MTTTNQLPANAGLDGWDDSETTVPEIVVSQAMSRIEGMDDIPKGRWVNKDEKQVIGKEIDVVALKVSRRRVLFYDADKVKADVGRKGVKCFSDDCKVPSPAVENPVSQTCSGCANEKLDLNITLLLLDVKASLAIHKPVVVSYTAKRTACEPIRQYISAIIRLSKPLPEFRSTLAVATKSNAKGTWYVPEFKDITKVDGDLEMLVAEAYRKYVAGSTESEDDDPEDDSDIPF